MLIFARDIVLTYPDYTPRSELMSNFDGIYLEKQYGVRARLYMGPFVKANQLKLDARPKHRRLPALKYVLCLGGRMVFLTKTDEDIRASSSDKSSY